MASAVQDLTIHNKFGKWECHEHYAMGFGLKCDWKELPTILNWYYMQGWGLKQIIDRNQSDISGFMFVFEALFASDRTDRSLPKKW